MQIFILLCLLILKISAYSVDIADLKRQIKNYPDIINSIPTACLPRSKVTQKKDIFICDPNQVLDATGIAKVEESLTSINSRLNQDAPNCDEQNPRPNVAVAVVDRMHLPKQIRDDEIINYASIFTYYLFNTWDLRSDCPDGSSKMIIFYSHQDKVVYTFVGKILTRKLPRKKILELTNQAMSSFGSPKHGLSHMIDLYREELSR